MRSIRSRRHQKNLNQGHHLTVANKVRTGEEANHSGTVIEEAEDVQLAEAEGNGEETGVTVKVRPHPKFAEIYQIALEDGAQRLGTRNLTPGLNVYGERLIKFRGIEYRVWDAFRSKLAAAIIKGLQNVPI